MQRPEMKMVVGLGNPGPEFVDTRHNAGFRVVDALAEALKISVKEKKFGGLFGQGEFEDKELMLLKPTQFMNRSGQA
ncbi:MAG: aminoacyl-tRNA hydrolase, partial [Planctomycetota bacterium]